MTIMSVSIVETPLWNQRIIIVAPEEAAAPDEQEIWWSWPGVEPRTAAIKVLITS
jgi:hypothetical protein